MALNPIEIGSASSKKTSHFGPLIAELVHATGPVSYDYQFGSDRRLLNAIVTASWKTPETLFAGATSTIATAGDDLVGVEIGFEGPKFYSYKANLGHLAGPLLESGAVSFEELGDLVARAEKASYLNAHVPEGVYYLHALSVFPQFRGKKAGARLLEAALDRARKAGYGALQLDVLADNPAVQFYRAFGLEVLAETVSPELSRDHGFPAELRMAIAL